MRKSLIAFGAAVLGLSLAACKVTTYQSPDGTLPEAYVSYAKPFLGTYQTSAGKVKLSLNGRRLSLTTDFDVTGEQCGSHIGSFSKVTVYPTNQGSMDREAPFDADFNLNLGSCSSWIPARVVTFHFNKALTGQPVYELSLVIQVGGHIDSHGEQMEETKDWDLVKTGR